ISPRSVDLKRMVVKVITIKLQLVTTNSMHLIITIDMVLNVVEMEKSTKRNLIWLKYEQSNFLGAKHVKLLDVPANVDNNSVTGILDTGSTTSVISKDLVDRLGIKYEKPEYSIIMASGRKELPIGLTKPIKLTIFGKTAYVRCPFTNLQDNILVGLDWFNETEINEDEIDLLELENDASWNTNSNQDLIDEKVLNEQELSNISLFMRTINDVFATDYNNLGRCKHVIRVENKHPIFLYPFRKSEKERQEIKTEIDKMFKAGPLAIVLNLLNKAGLKLNREKCEWFRISIKLLGFIVSRDVVFMDPNKIKCIKDRKRPEN
ncbi:pol poly, partial [Brachionus plicatilis]